MKCCPLETCFYLILTQPFFLETWPTHVFTLIQHIPLHVLTCSFKILILELCDGLYVLFVFATLDTNVGEAEGEDFGEGVEEDQGLASQGKPFTLISCYYLPCCVPFFVKHLVTSCILGLISFHHAYLLPSMLSPILTLSMLTPKHVSPQLPPLSSPP